MPPKPLATPIKPAPRVSQPALLQPKPQIRPRRWSVAKVGLSIGAGASLVAHAFVLLALGFTPAIDGARKEKPRLDYVLVNAKHSQAPRNAQALAQANMDGGGNTEQQELPTTPLPPEHADQAGDALVETTKRNEALEARTRALLAQKDAIAVVDQTMGLRSNERSESDAPKSGTALEDKRRAMAKDEAAIAKRLREYAARPRKTFVSARTKESGFALYSLAWRKLVEDIGSLKFPRGADGLPIYGSVMLSIEIDRKGRLAEVTIERSSGNRRLDEAAVRIVRMASPFKALPPKTARDTDILVMTETFRFQKVQGDSTLEVKNGQ